MKRNRDSEATATADDAAAAAAARQQQLQVEELVQAVAHNDLTTVQRLLPINNDDDDDDDDDDDNDETHQHGYESNGATICNGMIAYATNAADNAIADEVVTALHVASLHGHVEIVRYLLHHPSCDPNISSGTLKETALHLACRL